MSSIHNGSSEILFGKNAVAIKGERCLTCCVAKFGDFQKKCTWCAKCGAFIQYTNSETFLDAKMCSHTKLRGSLNLMRIQKKREECPKMRNACQDNKSAEVLFRC